MTTAKEILDDMQRDMDRAEVNLATVDRDCAEMLVRHAARWDEWLKGATSSGRRPEKPVRSRAEAAEEAARRLDEARRALSGAEARLLGARWLAERLGLA